MKTNKKPTDLDRLCAILNFGAEKLQGLKIDYTKIKVRKRLLLLMMVAAHNYTESILSLCKEDRTHACFALLRSLLENRINAKSLFTTNSMDGVYLFQLAGYEEQKKMLERLLLVNKNIPSHQIQIKIPDVDLMNSIKKIEDDIRKIDKKLKNKKGPKDLYNRSLAVDEFNKNKNKKSASLYSEYESMFRHLCSHSHLTFEGLDNFVSSEKNILEFFLSGNSEDLEAVLEYALYLYFEMLKMFLTQFKLPLQKELKNLYKTAGK